MKKLMMTLVMSSCVASGAIASYQPSNYYSEYPDVMLHTTIRPKAVTVKKEPKVEVQRYDENQFRNDPSVLVSLPHPVVPKEGEIMVVDHEKLKMAEQISYLENELAKYQAEEITGSLVDDGKVEYQWQK